VLHASTSTLSPRLELVLQHAPRVECIAQPIANVVDGEYRRENYHPWAQGPIGRDIQVVPGVGEQAAPGRSIRGKPRPRKEVVVGSAAYAQVKSTSSAVKCWPSCQATPCLRRQVTAVPSGDRLPLSTLGSSSTRIGIKSPSGL
jgi:hypothetical protein